jgi:hypothetical protein
MRKTKRFDPVTLARLRSLSAEATLRLLALDLKGDRDYVPVKNSGSRRWRVHTTRGDFEILTTGSKWYDTRAGTGGGGAIDLAMHVLDIAFVQAVRQLIQEAKHGPRHP